MTAIIKDKLLSTMLCDMATKVITTEENDNEYFFLPYWFRIKDDGKIEVCFLDKTEKEWPVLAESIKGLRGVEIDFGDYISKFDQNGILKSMS